MTQPDDLQAQMWQMSVNSMSKESAIITLGLCFDDYSATSGKKATAIKYAINAINNPTMTTAMAHNAMLREAAKKATDAFAVHYSNWNPLLTDEYGEIISPVTEALNATEADVTAWQEAFAKKAVEDHLGAGPYADVCKELATVKKERNDLLKVVDKAIKQLNIFIKEASQWN